MAAEMITNLTESGYSDSNPKWEVTSRGADFIGAASDQPWKAGGDVTGRSGKAVRMVE